MFVICSVPTGGFESGFFHDSKLDSDLVLDFGGIIASFEIVAAVMNGYKRLVLSLTLIASGYASSKRATTLSLFRL